MKYYKSETGEVFAYELDGSQDAYIKPQLTQMTAVEVQAHLHAVFAEVGESLQQIGGKCPDGWIVMQGERPSPEHVAMEDGSWVVPPTVVDPKLVGIEFQGVMCSATKEDMWGLSSVAPWIQGGNSTAFEFDNGNVLVLTPENYQAFYDVWASFRASFFNKVE